MEIVLIVLSGIILSDFEFLETNFCNFLSPNYKKMTSAINVLFACFTLELVSSKMMKYEVAKSILKHLLGHLGHLFGYIMAFFIIMPHQDSNNEETVFSNIYDSILKVQESKYSSIFF